MCVLRALSRLCILLWLCYVTSESWRTLSESWVWGLWVLSHEFLGFRVMGLHVVWRLRVMMWWIRSFSRVSHVIRFLATLSQASPGHRQSFVSHELNVVSHVKAWIMSLRTWGLWVMSLKAEGCHEFGGCESWVWRLSWVWGLWVLVSHEFEGCESWVMSLKVTSPEFGRVSPRRYMATHEFRGTHEFEALCMKCWCCLFICTLEAVFWHVHPTSLSFQGDRIQGDHA